MADAENNTEGQAAENASDAAGQARQVPVGFTGKRVPTSYANAFQTRVVDGMVCLSYGVSYGEPVAREGGNVQGLAVDMERRVVMTPDAAGRLVNALARLLRPAAGAAPAGSAEGAGEAETFGQD